jgi:outer membrane receptor for Fe3+-dicitrate
MGLRFEEINPPKKEEKPAAKKPAPKKAKTSKVEE